jgi:NAD(P)-dependent dehydrogenase (short-subunit alcohol dehydrogenase family)
MSKERILITGVSSGLGHGLAKSYLEMGAEVYGCSRRSPIDLVEMGLNFCDLDIAQQIESEPKFRAWIQELKSFDLVILNAGILGKIKDMQECSMDELKETMEVNLWANKWILDSCFAEGRKIKQVVGISSGASLSGSRGWNGYSISKAALNMLIKLYAEECPSTHFTSFAPGLVDTAMQDYMTALPADSRYAPIEILKAAKGTEAMPSGYDCAKKLINAFPRLLENASGGYADIRKL